MTTIEEMKAQHPEWCFTCGNWHLHSGGIHTCHENPVIAALIAAKLEKELK